MIDLAIGRTHACEVVGRMRSRSALESVPLVAMANEDERAIEELLAAGFSIALAKPFPLDDLVNYLRRALTPTLPPGYARHRA